MVENTLHITPMKNKQYVIGAPEKLTINIEYQTS